MNLKALKENSILQSTVKAVKYPTFAMAVQIVLEILTKLTDIQVFIPWLDTLVATGVLWTVAGFIFVYDVLKHTFGFNLP